MAEVAEKPDQELLAEFARNRQEAAFTELVRRHQAAAHAAAYRVCGDHAEAQDVLQQALITLARKAPVLGEVKCLGAWIHRVVVREAVRTRRKRINRSRREAMASEMESTAGEGPDHATAIRPWLDESLDGLRENDRHVLTLHYLEGRTFDAIARQLGGSAEAWQKRSVRALQKLAERLRRRGAPVSLVALGACLSGMRAEAGVTPVVLRAVTKTALDAGSAAPAGTLGQLAILMSMKTGITLGFLGGAAIACGWDFAGSNRPAPSGIAMPSGSQRADGLSASMVPRRNERAPAFSLELVREVMADFDRSDGREFRLESHLRSLMFLAPREDLEKVLQLLVDAPEHQRYQSIAAALFARWAEFNPEAAFARAESAGDFGEEGKRAVMLTWLNMDADKALSKILTTRTDIDRGLLSQFLEYKCERHPRDAATLVDRISREWPEADRPLFEQVARLWSKSEPLAAGDWVASYPDPEVKEPLLKSMAVDVAKIRGFDGLAIANHIEDAKLRQRTRNDAIYWWATTTAGISLSRESSPVRNLSGGFPDDWTDENIMTFSQAAMVNYTSKLPELLALADSDEQLMLIYRGVVKGAAWSNPAAVTDAAEKLPDSFVETPGGVETLQAFIKRWNEMDSSAATNWLGKQPDNAKTRTMRAALTKEAVK
jgi:RNA polymerase sigma factor (sigma-70 family)